MIDLPWPFEREYMQLALVAGLVVGACAPLVGTFVVQRRMSLVGDGIGHLAFTGIAAGLLLDVWPVWSALAVAVAGALAIEWLRARRHASGDLALAVFFYGGLAGGVVLVGLADSLDANLYAYLFGSIVTVDRSDVAVVAVLGLAITAAVLRCRRALFAIAVDEEWASVGGLPVARLNALVAVLVAVTVVASMRVVGILLVASLMVVPVAAAQVLSSSQRGLLGTAVAVGTGSVLVGLVAARQWGLAPGGTIVLVSIAVYAVAGISRRVVPTGSHAGH